MEALQNRITQLEETNHGLIIDRDRFKRLASLYQEEAFQEKLKSLTMTEEHGKTREDDRRRERELWDKERLKEREDWDSMMERKMEDLGKVIATERGEWEKRWTKEKDALEKDRVKEREEWEKKVEMVKKASEKTFNEENTRWMERFAREKAEWESEREQERVDWRRRLDDERDNWQRIPLGSDVVQRLPAHGQNSSRSNERTPKREYLAFPSMLTPHQTVSPPPASQVVQLITVKREGTTSRRPNSKSSQDIIDLSCDSPEPVVKMELDTSPNTQPEPIVIDDDEPVEATEPEPRPSRDAETCGTTPAPIPTATSTATSSSTLPGKKRSGKKIESFLSHSRREEYLHGTSLFTITPEYLPVAISRLILTRVYGSKTMGLDWMSSDSHKLLTPSYEWNPDMPRAPGEPGLLLVTYDTVVKYSPWTLFYKLETDKLVKWGYAGEYVCKEVGKFMKEEFAAQSDVVKKTWGGNVCGRRAEGAMLEMRARMTLRKHWKREPTQDEVKTEASKIKRNAPSFILTPQDVIDSIVSGEEHIKVFSMQCVDYIHTKAIALMTEQEKYEKEEEIKKVAKSKGQVSAGKGKAKKGTSSRKRLRDSSVDASSTEDEGLVEEHLEGDNSTVKPPQKRRKMVVASQSAGTSIAEKAQHSRKNTQSRPITKAIDTSDSLGLEDDLNDSDFWDD